MLLLDAYTHAFKYHSVAAAYRDEKIGTEEEINVIEFEFSMVVHVLQHGENVVIVFFCLGPLRPMATVLDLQFVKSEASGQFVEVRRCRIRNVKPRQMRQGRIHAAILEFQRDTWERSLRV